MLQHSCVGLDSSLCDDFNDKAYDILDLYLEIIYIGINCISIIVIIY